MVMGQDVSLRELRLVLEVAERRSFTDAAQAVHLSQSALSRAVNDVERRLEVRLFDRTTRSVEPTAVGIEVVRIARRTIAQHEQGLRELALFRDGLGGVVRIAAMPSVAATTLPALVASVTQRSPGIVIDIVDTLAHLASDHLVAGRVDLAITVHDGLPAGVTFTPLCQDRFRVVHRADHPFRDRPELTWRELATHPLVRFGTSSSLRDLTDGVFADLGLDPEPGVEAHNIAVIAGLVSAGLGVAAAPALVLPLMSFADLASTPLVEPSVDRTIGMAQMTHRSISPAAHHVAALLRETVWPGQEARRPATSHGTGAVAITQGRIEGVPRASS